MSLTATLLGWLILLLAIGAIGYTLLAALAVRRFVQAPLPPRANPEPVTLLKPLHGIEPGLRGNLGTFLDQDWPAPVQIVAGTNQADDPALAVVVITAFGTIESAVEAMRLGAFSYLPKPFKSADLLLVVERALEERHLRTEVQRLRKEVETHYQFEQIIGKSPPMQHLFDLMERLQDSTIDLLL